MIPGRGNHRHKGQHPKMVHFAKRLSFPLRQLTSDTIAGQMLFGMTGSLAGAGAGALVFGIPSLILFREKRYQAAGITIGMMLGGSVGSCAAGVSGAVTGLFFGIARLPLSIVRSIAVKDSGKLVTPLERTVKGSWILLHDPGQFRGSLRQTLNLTENRKLLINPVVAQSGPAEIPAE